MLVDITKVEVLNDYYLLLQFEDGTSGKVNIKKIVPFKGIFERLKNIDYFKTVFINPEIGTICWDNGADLSPQRLYTEIIK